MQTSRLSGAETAGVTLTCQRNGRYAKKPDMVISSVDVSCFIIRGVEIKKDPRDSRFGKQSLGPGGRAYICRFGLDYRLFAEFSQGSIANPHFGLFCPLSGSLPWRWAFLFPPAMYEE